MFVPAPIVTWANDAADRPQRGPEQREGSMRNSSVGTWKLIPWLSVSLLVLGAGCREADRALPTEESFRSFLEVYVERIHTRDIEYLQSVHPSLPSEMRDFFFDVTADMMHHSRDQGLQPTIECQEYEVCTVTWTQSDGSWAAQRFIRHEGEWRFLAE